MSGALAGLVVMDRSGTIAGQFCGKLFADFGAEVWLDVPTARPDIAAGGKGRAEGALDLHLNLGKRPGTPPVDPDIILCAPDEDPAAARARLPGAIAVRITGFGDDGPKARWAAPEIVLQASSGMMISNGTRGREPLYGAGNRASYAAGQAAYIQCLASLRVRAKNWRRRHDPHRRRRDRGRDVLPIRPASHLQRHRPPTRRSGHSRRRGSLPRFVGLPLGLLQPLRCALQVAGAGSLPDRSSLRRGDGPVEATGVPSSIWCRRRSPTATPMPSSPTCRR